MKCHKPLLGAEPPEQPRENTGRAVNVRHKAGARTRAGGAAPQPNKEHSTDTNARKQPNQTRRGKSKNTTNGQKKRPEARLTMQQSKGTAEWGEMRTKTSTHPRKSTAGVHRTEGKRHYVEIGRGGWKKTDADKWTKDPTRNSRGEQRLEGKKEENRGGKKETARTRTRGSG